MLTMTSDFARLWALGYTSLVPIIPPDADVSEHSSLYKRVNTRQDSRGKSPGVKGRDGKWRGFDWLPHVADEQDLVRWDEMGAGVGIKTGKGLIAIDADTTDEALAEIIRDTVIEVFGHLPVRVGRYPKALYLIRSSEAVQYQRVEFGTPDERGNKERVELLSDGRQFVAYGIHPATRKPYHWPKGLPPRDDLATATPEALERFWSLLRARLPNVGQVIKEGATAEVNQAALAGDYETVAAAVKATPNTSSAFPTREAYRDMGYAIKAALPDDPRAFDIWWEWCGRWDQGDNDYGVAEADWRRMKPPYRRGAGWLYEQAEALSGGNWSKAQAYFEPVAEAEPSPFDVQAETQREEAEEIHISASAYTFPDPANIPKREWLYGTHLIRKFVSATVAPSGVGKSSLIIAEALAMASGKPLLGITPKGQSRVWLWNGEDPLDELQRRVAAVMLHYGLAQEDVGDRLFLDSGRNLEIILAASNRDGTVIARPVAEALIRTITANRIDVMQVDPFVSSHRVSENDNGAIDMVSKQWAKIADTTGCAIDLVHHVRKLNGAEITVEDSRGAVSLIATSRSARALTKMQKAEATKLGITDRWQRFFRFGDGKNNLAPPSGEGALAHGWMEIVSVGLGNGSGSGLDRIMDGDSVGVVAMRTAAQIQAEGALGLETELVEAMDGDAGGAGVSAGRDGGHGPRFRALQSIGAARGMFRKDVRAGDAWVGVPIGRAFRLDPADKVERGKITAILASWLRDGTLVEVTRLDSKRMPRTYVEAPEKAPETSAKSGGGVFE